MNPVQGRSVSRTFCPPPPLSLSFFWKSPPFSALLKESTLSTCEFLSNNMMEAIFNPPSCRRRPAEPTPPPLPPAHTPDRNAHATDPACVDGRACASWAHFCLTRQQTGVAQLLQQVMEETEFASCLWRSLKFRFLSPFFVYIVCTTRSNSVLVILIARWIKRQ